MVKDVNKGISFILSFEKVFKYLNAKIIIYYIISYILCLGITYYLFIFCYIYKKSQISLLTNYFFGVVETLIKSFAVSLIVCIFRFIGLKCQRKRLYRTSIYFDDYF
jgi:hypothetical protein